MATQEEIEQLRTQFKEERRKRDRIMSTVFGILSIIALLALVYSFVQYVEAQKNLMFKERDHMVEMAEAQKEAVNCKNEIARLQNELTQCKK